MPETPYADVGTQTKEILAKIDKLLAEGGSDKGKSAQYQHLAVRTSPRSNEMNKSWERMDRAGTGAGARDGRGADRESEMARRDRGDRRDMRARTNSSPPGEVLK